MRTKKLKSEEYSIKLCIFKDVKEMYRWVDKRRTNPEEHNYNGIFLWEVISKCYCKGKHNKKDCDFRDSKHLGCICIPEEWCRVGVISHEVGHAIFELKHRYKLNSNPKHKDNETLCWILWDFVRQIVNFYHITIKI